MTLDERTLHRAIITAYGEITQIDICIEECSELIQALCKFKRAVNGHYLKKPIEEVKANLAEEMAHVRFMIDQMEILFCNSDAVKSETQKVVKKMQDREEIAKRLYP